MQFAAVRAIGIVKDKELFTPLGIAHDKGVLRRYAGWIDFLQLFGPGQFLFVGKDRLSGFQVNNLALQQMFFPKSM